MWNYIVFEMKYVINGMSVWEQQNMCAATKYVCFTLLIGTGGTKVLKEVIVLYLK